MIEFLKKLFKNTDFKTEDENKNKANKIVYSIIVIITIIFIGIIIYFLIKFIPGIIDSFQYNWNNTKELFNSRTI